MQKVKHFNKIEYKLKSNCTWNKNLKIKLILYELHTDRNL